MCRLAGTPLFINRFMRALRHTVTFEYACASCSHIQRGIHKCKCPSSRLTLCLCVRTQAPPPPHSARHCRRSRLSRPVEVISFSSAEVFSRPLASGLKSTLPTSPVNQLCNGTIRRRSSVKRPNTHTEHILGLNADKHSLIHKYFV